MIFDGVLRALAPPAELRRSGLFGELLNAVCSGPLEAVRLLQGAPGVRDVTLYGTVVHTLIDPTEQSPDQLRRWLIDRGIAVESLEPMEPTIEDVFVSLIRSAGRATTGFA
jgi:ABC-2 type transport system ATP-binding protein